MRNTAPLVSVVIPTYNRANLVADAINSVLAQTYPNVEVIVVDDGSSDGTLDLLRTYGSRIRAISQSNAGPSAARNRGVMEARGELVAFLDSDDLWLPHKLAAQVNLLQQLGDEFPCCLCNIKMQWRVKQSTSFEVAWLNPELAHGIWCNPADVLATRFLLFNQGVVIRREVLRAIGGFDESLWLLEDYELAFRLSSCGAWAFIREPLVIWRENETSSLSSYAGRNDLRWKIPLVRILEEQLHRVSNSMEYKSVRNHLNREIQSLRRQIQAAEVQKDGAWGARIKGRVMQSLERYRKAAFRRSPWFPKMKVESIEFWSKTHSTAIPAADQNCQRVPVSLHS